MYKGNLVVVVGACVLMGGCDEIKGGEWPDLQTVPSTQGATTEGAPTYCTLPRQFLETEGELISACFLGTGPSEPLNPRLSLPCNPEENVYHEMGDSNTVLNASYAQYDPGSTEFVARFSTDSGVLCDGDVYDDYDLLQISAEGPGEWTFSFELQGGSCSDFSIPLLDTVTLEEAAAGDDGC